MKYENGKTEAITSYTISPQKPLSPGENLIQISYGDFKKYITVIVEDKVSSITIEKMPNKTTYKVGETLDTTGLEVIVIYHGGKEAKVTSGLKCSPNDFKYYDSGVYTVYVDCPDSYNSFRAGNFDITIT